jgi:hypothetical protein
MGGGDQMQGKCTVEVVVDGAAEVEIQGSNATLRNLSGRPPQWRRFECTSPMPPNPVNFRFRGVDGRGRQELVRDPRNGGPAVVRIEDPSGGSEGYTFDIFWGGAGGYPGPGAGRWNEGNREGPRRFTTDEAVRACQDAVRRQAGGRFGGANVEFRDTRIDDNPGRRDWVIGRLDVRRGPYQEDWYRFSCSVNFDTGQIRSAEIQPLEGGSGSPEPAANRAIQNCRRAVQERLARDGYGRVDFDEMRVDNGPGRRDRIVGTVRADRGYRSDFLNFACSVDLNDGDVRGVDLMPRR